MVIWTVCRCDMTLSKMWNRNVDCESGSLAFFWQNKKVVTRAHRTKQNKKPFQLPTQSRSGLQFAVDNNKPRPRGVSSRLLGVTLQTIRCRGVSLEFWTNSSQSKRRTPERHCSASLCLCQKKTLHAFLLPMDFWLQSLKPNGGLFSNFTQTELWQLWKDLVQAFLVHFYLDAHNETIVFVRMFPFWYVNCMCIYMCGLPTWGIKLQVAWTEHVCRTRMFSALFVLIFFVPTFWFRVNASSAIAPKCHASVICEISSSL